PLSVTGLSAQLVNLNTRGNSLSGQITISATNVTVDLSTALVVTATNFTASIDLANPGGFVLTLGTLNVNIASGAVVIAATDILIAPGATGDDPIASVATADLTVNLGGFNVVGTLNDLVVYEDGVTLGSATLDVA